MGKLAARLKERPFGGKHPGRPLHGLDDQSCPVVARRGRARANCLNVIVGQDVRELEARAAVLRNRLRPLARPAVLGLDRDAHELVGAMVATLELRDPEAPGDVTRHLEGEHCRLRAGVSEAQHIGAREASGDLGRELSLARRRHAERGTALRLLADRRHRRWMAVPVDQRGVVVDEVQVALARRIDQIGPFAGCGEERRVPEEVVARDATGDNGTSTFPRGTRGGELLVDVDHHQRPWTSAVAESAAGLATGSVSTV